MKFLHTSDWHLGRSLYGRSRYDEFTAFLDWLLAVIKEKQIDVLLVAGDIFDTTTPSNHAQKLYYRFLCRAAATCCRHIVIIGGNHDSPSFLHAPKELLHTLNIHITGAINNSPEEEIITIADGNETSAIVCAVPYLRDKDIRILQPGETIDDKNEKLIAAITQHYTKVVALAVQKRSEIIKKQKTVPPIIAMGHLFTSGCKTTSDDGVRELYVGTLAHIDANSFPAAIDYLALGHLHVPQKVGKMEHFRYSGSPIPIGYGEANQQKSVVLVDFKPAPSTAGEREKRETAVEKTISLLPIPCFQQLIRLDGSLEEILAAIKSLKRENSSAWLEIDYTGKNIICDLRQTIEEAVTNSNLEIRRIKNRQITERLINPITEEESLDDLTTEDVFMRCLKSADITNEEQKELITIYNEIVKELQEADKNAE